MTDGEIHEVAAYLAQVRGWKRREVGSLFRIRRSRTKPHTSGQAGKLHGITITIGTKADRADVCEMVLHEMLHFELGRDSNGDWHGERFRLALAGTAQRAWGVTTDPHVRAGKRQNRAYALDDSIVAALRAIWGATAATATEAA